MKILRISRRPFLFSSILNNLGYSVHENISHLEENVSFFFDFSAL